MRHTLRRILLLSLCAWLLAGCGFRCALGGHSHPDMTCADVSDFKHTPFSNGKKTYEVYERGSGPPVLVILELPGMTPAFVRFARMLSDRGFHVYAPLLFGKAGCRLKPKEMLAVCRSDDFRCDADRKDPDELSAWLAALVRKMVADAPQHKAGVIGMCMTGNLAIRLMAEPGVAAAVASQPAVPFSIWHRPSASLGLPQGAIDAAVQSKVPLLALRFTNDCLANDRRFATLGKTFPPTQIKFFEINSKPENPYGLDPHAHAVLTEEYRPGTITDEAVQHVFRFLESTLK